MSTKEEKEQLAAAKKSSVATEKARIQAVKDATAALKEAEKQAKKDAEKQVILSAKAAKAASIADKEAAKAAIAADKVYFTERNMVAFFKTAPVAGYKPGMSHQAMIVLYKSIMSVAPVTQDAGLYAEVGLQLQDSSARTAHPQASAEYLATPTLAEPPGATSVYTLPNKYKAPPGLGSQGFENAQYLGTVPGNVQGIGNAHYTVPTRDVKNSQRHEVPGEVPMLNTFSGIKLSCL